MTALLNPPALNPAPAPMPTVTTPPPQPSGTRTGLRPFRYTLALFHRMGDMGHFEGRRAKLIRGVLLEEGPMDAPHAMAVEKGWYAIGSRNDRERLSALRPRFATR